MDPCAFSILEQKLSANLLHITALERVLAGSKTLENRLHRVDEQVCLHVLGLGAELKRAGHAEKIIELARRVGVDGEWAICRLGVHGYQLGPSAADDGYERGCGQGEERVGCDGGRDGAQVFLAILAGISTCSWRRSRCTHSTEEMSDEDDQLPGRNVRRIVQLLERAALALRIQHQQVAYAVQVLLGRYVIVDVYCPLELFLSVLEDRCLAGGREWRC
jgi:hypothetical protein